MLILEDLQGLAYKVFPATSLASGEPMKDKIRYLPVMFWLTCYSSLRLTTNRTKPTWSHTCIYSSKALEEGTYHKVSCSLPLPTHLFSMPGPSLDWTLTMLFHKSVSALDS